MTRIQEAYQAGFMAKCAEYGVPKRVAGAMLKKAEEAEFASSHDVAPAIEPEGYPDPLAGTSDYKSPVIAYRDAVLRGALKRPPRWHHDHDYVYVPDYISSYGNNHDIGRGSIGESVLTDPQLFDSSVNEFTPAGTNFVSSALGKPRVIDWDLIDHMTGKKKTRPKFPRRVPISSIKK